MANIWLISDNHFGHANILSFKNKDGTPLRVFDSVEQMDEYMIERWNSVVRPCDHVYNLGDLAMRREHIPIIAKCNGHKRLVLGNHDGYDMRWYTPYFEKIFATRNLDRFILSHVPLHPDSIGKAVANIHGHTHAAEPYGPRYFNVSVERIGYTPISLEDLKVIVRKRQEEANVGTIVC